MSDTEEKKTSSKKEKEIQKKKKHVENPQALVIKELKDLYVKKLLPIEVCHIFYLTLANYLPNNLFLFQSI
jgi:hypothetical protein